MLELEALFLNNDMTENKWLKHIYIYLFRVNYYLNKPHYTTVLSGKWTDGLRAPARV